MTEIRTALLGVLLAAASSAHAIRCESGDKTLYTEASACPVGYDIVVGPNQGSLSVLGKSEQVLRAETGYLSDRAFERSAIRIQDARSKQGADRSRSLACAALSDEAISVAASMEQSTDAHALGALRDIQRSIRDMQDLNDC